MRPTVRAAFVPFSAPLEGVCSWMYLDIKGLVTTAIGILIDPIEYALPLPWLTKDNLPPSRHEVEVEWIRIKARQYAKDSPNPRSGGGAFHKMATLHLDDMGIAQVVGRKVDQMDTYLATRFSEYEKWPADAQLATLSLAWACGPAFRFPHLEKSLKLKQFAIAAEECGINEKGNPGVKPRNALNKRLYQYAAKEGQSEPDVIHLAIAGMPPEPPSTKPELGTHETKPVDPELAAALNLPSKPKEPES